MPFKIQEIGTKQSLDKYFLVFTLHIAQELLCTTTFRTLKEHQKNLTLARILKVAS